MKTEDVVDLGETTTSKLEKIPVTAVTHGEKSSNKTPSNITTPPSLKTKGLVGSIVGIKSFLRLKF